MSNDHLPQFPGVDFSDFWDDCKYALKNYVSDSPSPELIAEVETRLGYTLPASYKALMAVHNGGMPRKTCFPSEEPTSWADDHVQITGILGVGKSKPNSLCGKFGSQFFIEEWGYPRIGVCICDCPSAGHDMVMLDYRKCGPTGEPEVVHVDQESGYETTFLAPNFESFICGLVSVDEYDTSDADLLADLERVEHGAFSTELAALVAAQTDSDFEVALRRVCKKITIEKGHFVLHGDDLSLLVYDIQFLLCSRARKAQSKSDYLDYYDGLIACGNGAFSTLGYAPAYVQEWLEARISSGEIVETSGGLTFDGEFERRVLERLDGVRE